jgi:hypothetical protein
MITLLWILLGLGVMVVLLSLTTVRCHIQYKRVDADDRINVTFRWWKWFRLRWTVPSLQLSGLTEDGKLLPHLQATVRQSRRRRWQERLSWGVLRRMHRQSVWLREHVHHLHQWFRNLLRRFHVESLRWHSAIGTGDAAETGVLTGLAWGLKSTVVGVAGAYVQWDRPPQIQVDPVFHEPHLETDFQCIVRFRIGHAILAGIRLLLNFRVRGGVKGG